VVDFASSACQAQWQSNDGVLPCPGQDGDPRGFLLPMNKAALEDGTTTSLPSILTFPSSSTDGYILGLYPQYQVQAGDHFQASVGCEYNATACSVLFRLSYLDSAGAAHDLWTLGEFYDGKYYDLNLDLTPLAGQQVRFVLSVGSLGSANGDRALWAGPRIVNLQPGAPAIASTPTTEVPAASATPTMAPTATPTVSPVPTATATTTPTPAAGGSVSPVQQFIDSVISFFQRVLGGQ
jgi:hypothetical protein